MEYVYYNDDIPLPLLLWPLLWIRFRIYLAAAAADDDVRRRYDIGTQGTFGRPVCLRVPSTGNDQLHTSASLYRHSNHFPPLLVTTCRQLSFKYGFPRHYYQLRVSQWYHTLVCCLLRIFRRLNSDAMGDDDYPESLTMFDKSSLHISSPFSASLWNYVVKVLRVDAW